jgi:hypothetical protein
MGARVVLIVPVEIVLVKIGAVKIVSMKIAPVKKLVLSRARTCAGEDTRASTIL